MDIDKKISDVERALTERVNQLLQADPIAQNLLGQKTAFSLIKEGNNGISQLKGEEETV